MTNSIEVQGRTEDEAIELALQQLGLTRDEVSVEIIEQAKTGFLGLKSSPAIVKVSYETEEEGRQNIEKFLTGLLAHMDIEAGFDITETEDSVEVNLTGSDPGVLIGRRGETLDAIQHLTNYVVNRNASNRLRINFDTENYRRRRSESLENLAKRTADKVVRYRKNMTLDPMNAYERHIIHSALQQNSQVSTFSIGGEPNRRVVIAYGNKSQKSDRPQGFRPDNRRSDNRRPDNRRSDNQRPDNRHSDTQHSEAQHSDAASVSEPQSTSEAANYREWS